MRLAKFEVHRGAGASLAGRVNAADAARVAGVHRRVVLTGLTGLAGLAVPVRGRGASAPVPEPWPAGRPTPALALPAWQGAPMALSAARGRVVLLNFWASWCEPCLAEMPSLELLAERHAAQGLEVWAVNFRETDGAVGRFMTRSGLSLPVLRDRDGEAARAFGVRLFPTTVVIGRDGRAMFSITGETDWTGPEARRWVSAWL